MFKTVFFVISFILSLSGGLYLSAYWIDSKTNVISGTVIVGAEEHVTLASSALHSDLIIADLHADTTLWNRDIIERTQRGHVDLPRLRAGNVAFQVFTSVTKSPFGQNYNQNSTESFDTITFLSIAQGWPPATWFSRTERSLYQANKLSMIDKKNPDQFRLVKNRSDLTAILNMRKNGQKIVGGILGIEGLHALDGKLENVDRLFSAGFRIMGLQHFFDNKLGGSLHGESNSGLTEFGHQVLIKMRSKHIIIDLAHSSEQVVKDVLSEYTTPVIVSHTGFKGHCDSARNINDSLMKRITQQGGIIGVGFWDGAVCGEKISDIVEAIKYGKTLVGIDHLALGSDFDGTIKSPIDASQLIVLTDALIKDGFSEKEIKKIMGENFINFFKEQLPAN